MAASAKWIEGLAADCTVEEAARRSVGPRLSSVVHLLPLAAHLAGEDVEHVHRLRVATRRATAALKLYCHVFPKKRVRWMKRRLRAIRRAAGDARDLDVLAARLTREYGQAVAPILTHIARERAAVQPVIVEVADLCRSNDQFVRKVAGLLRKLDGDTGDRCSQVSSDFGQWAREQFGRVTKDFLAVMPNETSTAAELHQFRIRAKAVRYVIELVADVLDADLRKRAYPVVEELQERLGNVQDHVAAIERCRGWREATQDDTLREALVELTLAEERKMTDSIRAYHEWWNADRARGIVSVLGRDDCAAWLASHGEGASEDDMLREGVGESP
ncbi:MAG: CHAD domain-containing protein [Pirellulales bacterium]|nr:CHAD domain-containing protein [Pirellulales bacterium]